MLGLPAATRYGPFLDVKLANGVSLDFHDTTDHLEPQHYAFLVGEDDFDAAFGRIVERGIAYWADPCRSQRGEINHHDGGRGVYFSSSEGHFLEIITRPYGG